MGFVRIFATVGTARGEYINQISGTQAAVTPGLNVRYLLASRDSPDTASNGTGMSIIFPPHAVRGSDIGTIELTIPDLRNKLKKGFLNVRMIDSVAYTINELEGITFDLSSDSIRLMLDIPASHQRDAASQKRKMQIARWNEDSIKWNPIANSAVAADGKNVTAVIAHFSTYAVVSEPGTFSAEVSVSPNPFSPRVRPGAGKPLGTCISVKPDMPEGSLQYLEVRIYNLLSDLVWGVQIMNALPEQYSVWWDGTTTDKVISRYDANDTWIDDVKGQNLCRNGRYFAVVIIKNMKNKEKKYMKQIVLMK